MVLASILRLVGPLPMIFSTNLPPPPGQWLYCTEGSALLARESGIHWAHFADITERPGRETPGSKVRSRDSTSQHQFAICRPQGH